MSKPVKPASSSKPMGPPSISKPVKVRRRIEPSRFDIASDAGPPREIEQCEGARVRLIFGKTTDSYLLILNEDDGHSRWQTIRWSNIPRRLQDQLNIIQGQGRFVSSVAYASDGRWFVSTRKSDGSGMKSWWGGTGIRVNAAIKERADKGLDFRVSFGNQRRCLLLHGDGTVWHCGYPSGVDKELIARLKKGHSVNGVVNFVRLFPGPSSAYFLSDMSGMEWKGLSENLSNELNATQKTVCDVAKADDDGWAIIYPHSFVTSTLVPKEVDIELSRFFKLQQERRNRRHTEIDRFFFQKREREETGQRVRELEQALEVMKAQRKRDQEEIARLRGAVVAKREPAGQFLQRVSFGVFLALRAFMPMQKHA